MINLHNSEIAIKNINQLIRIREFSVSNGGIFVYLYTQPFFKMGFKSGLERFVSEISKHLKE